MLPNHSSFAAIDEEHFLVGTRVHAALEKMSSSYLKREFRSHARRFLEEFCSTILSTVAARSKLGQGVSCFCPEVIIGGDDHSAFFLHGELLDILVECGWETGSNVEACKAEFQSFVREQRQLERPSTSKRLDVGNILAYFAQQTGFQSRRHLFRVSCHTCLGWTLLWALSNMICCRCFKRPTCFFGMQLRNCPYSLWAWMELLCTAVLWRSQLRAYRTLFGHPALPSAISPATMELLCLVLPSMLLAQCVTNRLVSRGRMCSLTAMRLLWLTWRRRMMLWLSDGKRHGIHQRDGSECAA